MNCILKSIHQLLISSKNVFVLSKTADPMRVKLNLSTSLPKPVLFSFPSIFSPLIGTTFPSISGWKWVGLLWCQLKHQALCIVSHNAAGTHYQPLLLHAGVTSCFSHGHLNVSDSPYVQIGRMCLAQSLVDGTHLLFQQRNVSSSSWTKHQTHIFQTPQPYHAHAGHPTQGPSLQARAPSVTCASPPRSCLIFVQRHCPDPRVLQAPPPLSRFIHWCLYLFCWHLNFYCNVQL